MDWRSKVSVPGNQANCGSCWAWTTAATLEGLNAIKNNLSVPEKFSVQYLVDCDSGNYGCDGGWMLDAYSFVSRNGIVRESDYPGYSARKQACRDHTTPDQKFYIDDMKEEDNVSNERMKVLVSK